MEALNKVKVVHNGLTSTNLLRMRLRSKTQNANQSFNGMFGRGFLKLAKHKYINLF